MYKIIIFFLFAMPVAFDFSTVSAKSGSCKQDSLNHYLLEEFSSCPAKDKSQYIFCTQNDSAGGISEIFLNSISGDSIVFELNQNEIAEKAYLPLNDEEQKKWIPALFAFPFPLGFVGTHRVMMGTKPWIPIAYIATFGGCFGLLPLIDFFVILYSKDIDQYENNPNLFMWIGDKD